MATDSHDVFRQVRDAVDIVDIIAEHVALKKAGREFKGLCPFHDDHRPSMAVVPHKQIFHCFVCGMGGDVFKFVREFHKMTAGEALRHLAQRAGIALPELRSRDGRPAEGPSVREQIIALNETACQFFQKHLRSPEGKAGLDYFHSRGLSDETIEKFRLGMAPDSWTGLTTYALRLGINGDQLETAGLVKKRSDGSAYDVFRNRVMFPIADAMGRIIAFGGRVLVEKRDDQGVIVEAKYLNTPETRVFNKSESIYGINHARQHIVRTRTAVVVEGYMDVIACHQAGVSNVIATLGTALTPQHSRTLKNYAQTIVLIFDSDDAGRRAAERAMEVFIKSPLDVRITAVPDGKDPCDFCMKNGGDPFQKLIDGAVDALSFQWTRLTQQIGGTDSVTARQEAITQFVRFAAASMGPRKAIHEIDPIRRGQLIVKLAKTMGLPVDEVTGLLYNASYRQAPATRQKQEDGQERSSRIKQEQQVPYGKDAALDAERWALGCLLNDPKLYRDVREDMDIRLFRKCRVGAIVVITYLEERYGDDQCSLSDFTSYVESLRDTNDEADLVIYCAILWERTVGDWLDLAVLSSLLAKLVRYWRQALGHTPKMVLLDCVEFLKRKAGELPPIDAENFVASVDFAALDETAQMKHVAAEIEARRETNRLGGNVRNVGYHESATDPLSQRMQQREETVAMAMN
jgi:DNA primase